MCELSSELLRAVPGAELTLDVVARPITYQTQSEYDYTSLSLCVDHFVVMAYDMLTPDMARLNITAANSPVDLVKSGVEEYAKLGISAEKLVLALPFFGNTFTCANVSAPAGSDGRTGCTPDPAFIVDPDAFGLEVGFNAITTELLPLSHTGVQWSSSAASPWFDYVNATDGKRRRIWYDNATSLAIKVQLACGLKLGGVGAWIADALPVRDPSLSQSMWTALRRPTPCVAPEG